MRPQHIGIQRRHLLDGLVQHRLVVEASDVPGLAAAVLRAVASLALIVGGILAFLALDIKIAGHEWPALLSLTALLSWTTGLLWYARRVRLRRQEAAS